MTNARKALPWLGALASLLGAAYAATSVIFYAWLNAAEPDRWPAEKAAVWAYSSLAIAIVFLGLFIFCVVVVGK